MKHCEKNFICQQCPSQQNVLTHCVAAQSSEQPIKQRTGEGDWQEAFTYGADPQPKPARGGRNYYETYFLFLRLPCLQNPIKYQPVKFILINLQDKLNNSVLSNSIGTKTCKTGRYLEENWVRSISPRPDGGS